MANIDDVEDMVDEEIWKERRDALFAVLDALKPLPKVDQRVIITSAEVFLGHGDIELTVGVAASEFAKTHDEHGDDLPTRTLPDGPPYPKKRDPT